MPYYKKDEKTIFLNEHQEDLVFDGLAKIESYSDDNEESTKSKIHKLDATLADLDSKKIRSMSSILAADESKDTSKDREYLLSLDSQSSTIRKLREELLANE